MSDSALPSTPLAASHERLPLGGLLALACAGFITILTEAMPAGLLPQMGAGLGVSPALVGQLVTFYALGSLLAAIPLTLLTRGRAGNSRTLPAKRHNNAWTCAR